MPARLHQARLRPLAAVALAVSSLVATAAVGSVFLSSALDAGAAVAAPGPSGPADGILVITGLGGTILALWLGLGMALSALSALPGALGQLCRRLAARVAPVAVRKVAAFLLGTTLTAALIPGTAVAGITPGAGSAAVVTSQQSRNPGSGVPVAAPEASFRLIGTHAGARPRPDAAVTPGAAVPPATRAGEDAAPPPSWSPKRPKPRSGPPSGLRPPLSGRGSTPTGSVVVLRGDTLWSIAARHLDSSTAAASAADIEVEWHRWLAANRGVIGQDADLILPGQLLRPPPPHGSES
jgi:nucleoid-associated protein YgaU